MARRLGATDEQLDALERGSSGAFEEGWRAAIQYAEAITPTRGLPSDELMAELDAYWTPAQIVEITAVIGLFNYFNRFAEALRIPVTR